MIWPSKASFNPLVAGLILTVPPAMRLIWAPALEPLGLLVALGVSLATLMLYYIGGQVAERQRGVRRKREAQLSLAAEARERSHSQIFRLGLQDRSWSFFKAQSIGLVRRRRAAVLGRHRWETVDGW